MCVLYICIILSNECVEGCLDVYSLLNLHLCKLSFIWFAFRIMQNSYALGSTEDQSNLLKYELTAEYIAKCVCIWWGEYTVYCVHCIQKGFNFTIQYKTFVEKNSITLRTKRSKNVNISYYFVFTQIYALKRKKAAPCFRSLGNCIGLHTVWCKKSLGERKASKEFLNPSGQT